MEDRLFATLDSTSRQLKLSTGSPVVISDTVGFISNLPHHLVASFRATLMEAMDADLLLHVVDISDPRHEYYIQEVNEVLAGIGADGIEQIMVMNKCDLLDERMQKLLERYFEDAVFVSAAQGQGIEALLARLESSVLKNQSYQIKLPYAQTALVSRLHEIGRIDSEDYREDGIFLSVTVAAKDKHLIMPYLLDGENH